MREELAQGRGQLRTLVLNLRVRNLSCHKNGVPCILKLNIWHHMTCRNPDECEGRYKMPREMYSGTIFVSKFVTTRLLTLYTQTNLLLVCYH